MLDKAHGCTKQLHTLVFFARRFRHLAAILYHETNAKGHLSLAPRMSQTGDYMVSSVYAFALNLTWSNASRPGLWSENICLAPENL